jgi:hypothetical protein
VLIQEIVRGVSGLERGEVDEILNEKGFLCAALRNGVADSIDVAEKLLSTANLRRHQNDYPAYADETPYISTSAGTYVEGGRWRQNNRARFAFTTALDFAVLGPRRDGWIFYGYVFLPGREAGQHAEFAEELRDLHQHPAWSRYRAEGEVAVAVRIPPRRLRRAELYTYDRVARSVRAGVHPEPEDVIDNEEAGVFQAPDHIASARGVI